MAKMVTNEEVERVRSILGSLPQKEAARQTRKDAVLKLRSEIKAALDRGYSLQEIVDIIGQTQTDLAGISLSTLRTYLKIDQAAEKGTTATRNVKRVRATKQMSTTQNKETSVPSEEPKTKPTRTRDVSSGTPPAAKPPRTSAGLSTKV